MLLRAELSCCVATPSFLSVAGVMLAIPLSLWLLREVMENISLSGMASTGFSALVSCNPATLAITLNLVLQRSQRGCVVMCHLVACFRILEIAISSAFYELYALDFLGLSAILVNSAFGAGSFSHEHVLLTLVDSIFLSWIPPFPHNCFYGTGVLGAYRVLRSAKPAMRFAIYYMLSIFRSSPPTTSVRDTSEEICGSLEEDRLSIRSNRRFRQHLVGASKLANVTLSARQYRRTKKQIAIGCSPDLPSSRFSSTHTFFSNDDIPGPSSLQHLDYVGPVLLTPQASVAYLALPEGTKVSSFFTEPGDDNDMSMLILMMDRLTLQPLRTLES